MRKPPGNGSFSSNCRRCQRLAGFLDRIRSEFPGYYAKPVAPFGDSNAKLLIIGLAPGMHGANRTGRPFTGDHAGILLYRTLHKFGFASGPESISADDGLRLTGCRITNAVKCLPPENKPENREIGECNGYLADEIAMLASGSVLLALGNIAHRAALMAVGLKPRDYRFAHGAIYRLPNELTLYDSYHCSRYNTQTRRLTETMFNQVFNDIVQYLSKIRPKPLS